LIVIVNWSFAPEENIQSAVGLHLALFEPESALSYYYGGKNPVFTQCPAFTDALKNTYVIKCPIDLEVKVDKENNTFELVHPERFPTQLLEARVGEEGNSEHPPMSFQILPYLFTSDDNVEVELLHPFLEWGDLNWRLISGRFNISKWKRPISFAVECRDKVQTIKFKRGQPITYARFITPDGTEPVKLKHVTLNKEDHDEYMENLMLKHMLPKKSLSYVYELREKLNKSLGKS